jgi:hypothetical protein
MKTVIAPKSIEWLNTQAKEIYKFNGFVSAPELIQNHFIKMVKIYLYSNKIKEISAQDLNKLIPGLYQKDCLNILIKLNKQAFEKKT